MQIIDSEIKPENGIELEIPCPKSVAYGGKCSGEEYHWECDECSKWIMFEKPENDEVNLYFIFIVKSVVIYRCLFNSSIVHVVDQLQKNSNSNVNVQRHTEKNSFHLMKKICQLF